MKPRTKLQQKIYNLSQTLPPLAPEQKAWGLKHALDHVGYRTKKHISCLDCGHVWDGPKKVKSCACPSCNTRIKVVDTLKRKLKQRVTMCIMDVRDEYQVVRIIEIFSYHKSGEKPCFFIDEVVRQFFNPDCEMLVVAQLLSNMGNFQGCLEIRSTKGWYGNKYDMWVDKMYPLIKCLPIYKRNGFKCPVDRVQPYQVLSNILADTISETLLKVKQVALLAARTGNKRWEVSKHWNSIKICIRTKYVIKPGQAITWLDYLDLLEYYKKDLRNPKYVCPANLKKAHDTLAAKKQADMKHKRNWIDYQRLMEYFGDEVNDSLRNKPVPLQLEVTRLTAHKAERQRRESAEKLIRKVQEDQQQYAQSKGMFFGMSFSNGNLTVAVLQSVEEFLKEGEAMKHCVFSNEYFKKENSLILSARMGDQPIETVEVALDKLQVVQSRGLGNAPSLYHDDIVKLVRKNMKAIADRQKTAKQEAA